MPTAMTPVNSDGLGLPSVFDFSQPPNISIRDRNTGKVTSKTFFGDSPFGK